MNPGSLSEGPHTFFYNLSGIPGECETLSSPLNVNLVQVPIPTIEGVADGGQFCRNNEDEIELKSNIPGGQFSGPGVQGNLLSLAGLTVGIVNVTYTVVLPSGCIASNLVSFEIIDSIECVQPLNLALVIGVASASFCCLACLLIFVILFSRRRIKQNKKEAEIELKDKVLSDVSTQYAIIPGLVLSDEAMKKFSLDEHWNVNMSELELEKEIGKGAFGIVYKARWRGKIVAVKKVLAAEMTEVQVEDFAKEVKLMQTLRPHPNVVGLLGVVKSPLSIVTTFYSSGSLFDLIQNTKLTIPQVISIMKDVASGTVFLKKNSKNF